MAKKRKRKPVNVDAWLNTYADMITLVLVFFILLFSMSSMDKEKYKLLVRAFTSDPATIEQLMKESNDIEGLPDTPDGLNMDMEDLEDIKLDEIEDLDELYKYLKKYVKDNDLEASVQVERNENIVYVRFMSNLFFEPNKSRLKTGGKLILSDVGTALAHAEKIARFIRIDGHTAEASPGNDTVNNRDLSTERANVVLKYLESGFIREPAKLFAVGYGLHRPIAPNDSEENRAKNRRVEILVGKEDPLQDELDKIYGIGN